MYIKIMLALVIWASISNVNAEDSVSRLCSNARIKNPINEIFNTSRTMKHKFTNLYRLVESEVENYFMEACKDKKDLSVIVDEAENVCKITCDKNADLFITNVIFGKKEMGREIFNECASVCSTMRYSHAGYIEGVADANKNSNDGKNPAEISNSTFAKAIDDKQALIEASKILFNVNDQCHLGCTQKTSMHAIDPQNESDIKKMPFCSSEALKLYKANGDPKRNPVLVESLQKCLITENVKCINECNGSKEVSQSTGKPNTVDPKNHRVPSEAKSK